MEASKSQSIRSKNHKPRLCVEDGCNEVAGTPWGPYWCPKHDQERRDRITKQLDAIVELLADKGN